MYLIQNDGQQVETNEESDELEDLLQGLLAQHPNLLAGNQIGNLRPRRWLLVSRKGGLHHDEGGQLRWSVDNLSLDQDAIPMSFQKTKKFGVPFRARIREGGGEQLKIATDPR